MNKLKNAGISLLFTLFLMAAGTVVLDLIAVLLKLCSTNGPAACAIIAFGITWSYIHYNLKEDGVLQ